MNANHSEPTHWTPYALLAAEAARRSIVSITGFDPMCIDDARTSDAVQIESAKPTQNSIRLCMIGPRGAQTVYLNHDHSEDANRLAETVRVVARATIAATGLGLDVPFVAKTPAATERIIPAVRKAIQRRLDYTPSIVKKQGAALAEYPTIALAREIAADARRNDRCMRSALKRKLRISNVYAIALQQTLQTDRHGILGPRALWFPGIGHRTGRKPILSPGIAALYEALKVRAIDGRISYKDRHAIVKRIPFVQTGKSGALLHLRRKGFIRPQRKFCPAMIIHDRSYLLPFGVSPTSDHGRELMAMVPSLLPPTTEPKPKPKPTSKKGTGVGRNDGRTRDGRGRLLPNDPPPLRVEVSADTETEALAEATTVIDEFRKTMRALNAEGRRRRERPRFWSALGDVIRSLVFWRR